jgi:hypothetical protein
LGERTKALHWLRHAVDEREPQSIIAPVDPRLAELRTRPEFQQMLVDMKLARPVPA